MRNFCLIAFSLCLYMAQGQVWSPDGKKIAFFYIHAIEDIYTVSPDGTDFKTIDGHPNRDFAPHWSPDGKKIVFTSVRDGHHELYEISSRGNNLRKLTHTEHNSEDGFYSPDGKSMVFSSDRSGNNEIYIMELSTGKVSRVTDTEDIETTTKWSVDGKLLFRSAKNSEAPSNLYVMNVDGSDRKQLTNSAQGEFHQSWSWDAKKICYVTVLNGVFEIHVMDSDGSNDRILVQKEGYQAFFPCWSPNNKLITFTRDVMEGSEEGLPALFAVDMEGNEHMISNGNSFE